MKKLTKFNILTLIILLTSCGDNSQPSAKIYASGVIYKEDNRIDTYELKGSFWADKARSVAMKIRNRKMKKISGGKVKLLGRVLGKYKTMCEDEKFVKQRINADCTGFLIDDDLIATAGHCVKDQFDCDEFSWAFDYSLEGPDDKSYHIIPMENFYTCKKIISSVYDKNRDLDFAIIQLDRKVVGRIPLKIRTEGKIKTSTKLALIGHPSGLPKKFADGAEVIKNEDKVFFKANLDSFQINSGSPVFNAENGLVEGILVRGDMDYHWDYKGKCNRVNTIKLDCKDRDCRLEDVTRITMLPKS